ncbi:Dihydropteroate synthase-like protein [Tribonema minus]|uniref:Dihydropteroate synthase-like protein n=1 Tax=Tribonema minus TaxID=303371 RepID=A0A835YYJ5_9STRA|nr:Dihydropteroate synthase-like protein [Tribonema minus]
MASMASALAGTSSRQLCTAYIALGSNVGDRHGNLLRAYRELRSRGIGNVVTTSGLYQTKPQYVADQPMFLNAALRLDTSLPPALLLRALKDVERDIGRVEGQRWGPRVVDLDILLYGDVQLEDDSEPGRGADTAVPPSPDPPASPLSHLQVPHPRMHEREFVLRPLADIAATARHPALALSVEEMLSNVRRAAGGGGDDVVRVLPLGPPRGSSGGGGGGGSSGSGSGSGGGGGDTPLWDMDGPTRVMGILNVTPDSFSDGGRYYGGGVEAAVAHARAMAADGADIIDIGGESTRPGADDVEEAIELERVVPVVAALRAAGVTTPISVDTRRAAVARGAVRAGADLVNDVSGGAHDGAMLAAVAELGVPYVAMHMRGTPKTMTAMTDYADVVGDVTQALSAASARAEAAGVPRWLQVLDPGLGFAKTAPQSVQLLAGLVRVAAATRCPLLVGPSRKRFVGAVAGGSGGAAGGGGGDSSSGSSSGSGGSSGGNALTLEDRDWGTAGAACAAAERGARIVRVHHVRGVKHALRVVDAVRVAEAAALRRGDQ